MTQCMSKTTLSLIGAILAAFAGLAAVGPGTGSSGSSSGSVSTNAVNTNQFLYNSQLNLKAGAVVTNLSGTTGTAATPTFEVDAGTGMFKSGTDAIGFSTDGVERWVFNASGSLVPVVGGTYDIGNGLSDPRDITATRNITAAEFSGGGGGLTSASVATNANQFVTLSQLETAIPTGTVVNTGASTVGAVPRYTDLTGTNVAPTGVTISGSDLTGAVLQSTKAFRSYQGSLTHAGTVTLDFDATTTVNSISLTGAVTFALSNLATNRTYRLRIANPQATNCTVTLPSNTSTNFLGGAPTTITAGKVAMWSLESWGAANADVISAWAETQ